MRLIDADALNARLQKQVGSPTSDDLYEVNLCIIEAPTIAAIPVEWLRNLCAIAKMETDDEMFIDWLIQTWQEEQEPKEG